MKLILKTNTETTYFVRLPNHMDLNNVPAIIEDAKYSLPDGVQISSHAIHSDQLTHEERKQLDLHGKIVNPLIEIDANVFAL